MTNYLSLHELVKKIETNINQLEVGLLNHKDLEVQLELVRELYERTLILRYKAFETSTSVEVRSVEVLSTEVTELQQEIPVVETSTIEPAPVETEMHSTAEEMPVATEIEFDFFSSSKEIMPETEHDAVVKAEQSVDFSSTATVSAEDELEQQHDFKTELTPISETEQENEQVEELIRAEEAEITLDVENTLAPQSTTNDQSILAAIVNQKFEQLKAKMNSQLGFYALPSLIGSFGLNERLLYINELFDGSSESFSEAIKQLDGKTSLSDAAIFTTELVHKFNWDIESDTVEELFHKICRRYA